MKKSRTSWTIIFWTIYRLRVKDIAFYNSRSLLSHPVSNHEVTISRFLSKIDFLCSFYWSKSSYALLFIVKQLLEWNQQNIIEFYSDLSFFKKRGQWLAVETIFIIKVERFAFMITIKLILHNHIVERISFRSLHLVWHYKLLEENKSLSP